MLDYPRLLITDNSNQYYLYKPTIISAFNVDFLFKSDKRTHCFVGGHDTFVGFINSLVHMIMYSYYLVTTLNPEYKKNIWWKKHITQLQMVRFVLNVRI